MKFWFVYEHMMAGEADTKVQTIISVFGSRSRALQFIANQNGNEGRPLFRGYTYEAKYVPASEIAEALSMFYEARVSAN